MSDKHKTLADCKDEVAIKYNFSDWKDYLNRSIRIIGSSEDITDEAAELYASEENRKKDETVSGDLQQADIDAEIQEYLNSPGYIEKRNKLIDKVNDFVLREFTDKYINEHCLNYSEKEKTIVRNSIHVGYLISFKWQSQQPLSIAWMSDEEISKFAMDYDEEMGRPLPDNQASRVLNFKRGANTIQSELRKRVNVIDTKEAMLYVFDNLSSGLSRNEVENRINDYLTSKIK